MDNSLKGLMLAAGVVITCIVVGLGFYISREAKNTSSGGISQITSMNSEFQESDKMMYDGINVSGREVIQAVEKFEEELKDKQFEIVVYTGKLSNEDTAITFDSNHYSTASVKDRTQETYINPDGTFAGDVTKDENGVIATISFKQQ